MLTWHLFSWPRSSVLPDSSRLALLGPMPLFLILPSELSPEDPSCHFVGPPWVSSPRMCCKWWDVIQVPRKELSVLQGGRICHFGIRIILSYRPGNKQVAKVGLRLHLSFLRADHGPLWNVPSLNQGEKDILVIRNGELRLRGICTHRPC